MNSNLFHKGPPNPKQINETQVKTFSSASKAKQEQQVQIGDEIGFQDVLVQADNVTPISKPELPQFPSLSALGEQCLGILQNKH